MGFRIRKIYFISPKTFFLKNFIFSRACGQKKAKFYVFWAFFWFNAQFSARVWFIFYKKFFGVKKLCCFWPKKNFFENFHHFAHAGLKCWEELSIFSFFSDLTRDFQRAYGSFFIKNFSVSKNYIFSCQKKFFWKISSFGARVAKKHVFWAFFRFNARFSARVWSIFHKKIFCVKKLYFLSLKKIFWKI